MTKDKATQLREAMGEALTNVIDSTDIIAGLRALVEKRGGTLQETDDSVTVESMMLHADLFDVQFFVVDDTQYIAVVFPSPDAGQIVVVSVPLHPLLLEVIPFIRDKMIASGTMMPPSDGGHIH